MRLSQLMATIAFAATLLSAGCCCHRCHTHRPFWRMRAACASPCAAPCCAPTTCCSSPAGPLVPYPAPPLAGPLVPYPAPPLAVAPGHP